MKTNTKYNVLWVDDEHDHLESIHTAARKHGIELIGYKNATDASSYLDNSLKQIDAILLDGKFYKDHQDQSNELVDDTGFGLIASQIRDLKIKGVIIPWFILSGQADFVKEENSLVKLMGKDAYNNGRVYDKNKDEESKLFPEMVKAIEESDTYKIKQKYAIVFEVLDEKYLGGDEEGRLLEILKNLESPVLDEYSDDKFNPIRKMLEKILNRLRDYNLAPKDMTSLTLLSLFLAGKHRDYELQKEFLSNCEKYLLRGLVDLSNEGSHNLENHRIGLSEHLKKYQSPFIYKSTAFKFLELLLWFKHFIDKHPSPSENEKLWSKLENTVKGQLERDNDGNHHIGQYYFLPTKLQGIEIGSKLEITSHSVNTHPQTKQLYPHFVKSFKKVDEL